MSTAWTVPPPRYKGYMSTAWTLLFFNFGLIMLVSGLRGWWNSRKDLGSSGGSTKKNNPISYAGLSQREVRALRQSGVRAREH